MGSGPAGIAPVAAITVPQWRAMRPFVVVGLAAITAGGLVAAVTGPTGLTDGSWAAAYLVLVAGVGQLVLGAGQVLLTCAVPPARRLRRQLVLFNVANAAVLAGTLEGALILTVGGGVALFVALILFLPTTDRMGVRHRWYRVAYRLLLGLLAVSIPVGVALSALRGG